MKVILQTYTIVVRLLVTIYTKYVLYVNEAYSKTFDE